MLPPIGMPNMKQLQQMMQQGAMRKPQQPQASQQPASTPQFGQQAQKPADPALDKQLAQILKKGNKLDIMG